MPLTDLERELIAKVLPRTIKLRDPGIALDAGMSEGASYAAEPQNLAPLPDPPIRTIPVNAPPLSGPISLPPAVRPMNPPTISQQRPIVGGSDRNWKNNLLDAVVGFGMGFTEGPGQAARYFANRKEVENELKYREEQQRRLWSQQQLENEQRQRQSDIQEQRFKQESPEAQLEQHRKTLEVNQQFQEQERARKAQEVLSSDWYKNLPDDQKVQVQAQISGVQVPRNNANTPFEVWFESALRANKGIPLTPQQIQEGIKQVYEAQYGDRLMPYQYADTGAGYVGFDKRNPENVIQPKIEGKPIPSKPRTTTQRQTLQGKWQEAYDLSIKHGDSPDEAKDYADTMTSRWKPTAEKAAKDFTLGEQKKISEAAQGEALKQLNAKLGTNLKIFSGIKVGDWTPEVESEYDKLIQQNIEPAKKQQLDLRKVPAPAPISKTFPGPGNVNPTPRQSQAGAALAGAVANSINKMLSENQTTTTTTTIPKRKR
jgi:hypothetical protein